MRSLLAALALALMSGCTEAPLSLDSAPASAPPGPPEAGVCQLVVSGLMPPAGPPSLQGNGCHVEDVLAGLAQPGNATIVVSWDSLQPSLAGRVQARLEAIGCDHANGCALAQGAAYRTGPIVIELGNGTLPAAAGKSPVVRVYPEGYSFQQPFKVRVTRD